MSLKLVIVCFLFTINITYAAFVELKYDNAIYEKNINSVIISQVGSQERFPIMPLTGINTLKLSFDEMKGENDFYNYTFIHCDANWEPSNLQPNEYINGMNVDNITNYSFATSTFIRYTHYELVFPQQTAQPKISGNYILLVFRNFNQADIVLSRRFMVIDDKTIIESKITAATNPEKRYSSHEINFTVDYKNYIIPNPYKDVKVTMMQNNRWDNAIKSLTPTYVSNNLLTYNYINGNVFDAGNEFRYFDLRSIRGVSLNVKRKYFDSSLNIKRALLRYDATRENDAYLYWIDYNGKRVFDNKDINSTNVNEDYILTSFNLLNTKEFYHSDVYVFGELTDWQINENYKMNWNEYSMSYELDVPLKQAYYDYCYILKNQDSNEVSIAETEGNHFETENDYFIMIYHKNQAYKYDELIGYKYLNSRNLGR